MLEWIAIACHVVLAHGFTKMGSPRDYGSSCLIEALVVGGPNWSACGPAKGDCLREETEFEAERCRKMEVGDEGGVWSGLFFSKMMGLRGGRGQSAF